MQAYSAFGSKMSQITVTNLARGFVTEPVTKCANETILTVDIPFAFNNIFGYTFYL